MLASVSKTHSGRKQLNGCAVATADAAAAVVVVTSSLKFRSAQSLIDERCSLVFSSRALSVTIMKSKWGRD